MKASSTLYGSRRLVIECGRRSKREKRAKRLLKESLGSHLRRQYLCGLVVGGMPSNYSPVFSASSCNVNGFQRGQDRARMRIASRLLDRLAMSVFLVKGNAASLGFEPRQRDPESLVLPLHHEATAEEANAKFPKSEISKSRAN